MGPRQIQRLAPVTVGLHIGSVHENTALCVASVTQKDTGKVRLTGQQQTIGHHDERGNWIPPQGSESVMATEYNVRSMERLPLSVSYPDLAAHIAKVLSNRTLLGHNVRVLANVTDVGMPTWLTIKKDIGLQLHEQIRMDAILFQTGEQYNRSRGTIGKAYLVSRVQSLLQSGYVHGPDSPEMKRTCDELMTYNVKPSENDIDGRIGTNEGLAISLALCCLVDPHSEKVTYSERVY